MMNRERMKRLITILVCTSLFSGVSMTPWKLNVMNDYMVFAAATDEAAIINNIQADFVQLDSDLEANILNWTLLNSASSLLNSLSDRNSSKAALSKKLDVYRAKLTIAALSANCDMADYDRIKVQISKLQTDTSTKQELTGKLAYKSDKRIMNMISPLYSYAYEKMSSQNVTKDIIRDTNATLHNIVSLLSHVVLDENKNNIISTIAPLVTIFNSKSGYYFDINYELNNISKTNTDNSNSANSPSSGTVTDNTNNTTTQINTKIYSITPAGNSINSSSFYLRDPIFKHGDIITVTYYVSGAGALADNIFYDSNTGIPLLLDEKQYHKLYDGKLSCYIDVKGPNYTRNYNFTYVKDSSMVPILKPMDVGSIVSTKVTKSMNTFDIADLILGSRDSFDYMVIASKNSFADCLSGAMLSSRLGAPILMVDDSDVEILKKYLGKRMTKNGTIFLLGEEGAVSKKLEYAVSAYGNIKRLGGTDRFDTNKKILDAMELKVNSEIIIASGNVFSDAVSASTASGKYNMPIFLAGTDGLSNDMLNKIQQIKPSKVTIVGGKASVGEAAESQLSSIGIKNVNRITGIDREKTSMALINNYFPTGLNTIFLIDKDDFALGMSLAPLTVVSSSAMVVNMSNDIDYVKKKVQANNYIDLIRH